MFTAYDGKEEKALERNVESLFKEKKYLYGGAILDENESMIGSSVVVEFESREAVEVYLRNEPYVKGSVWQEIEVKPYRVAPLFMDLYK